MGDDVRQGGNLLKEMLNMPISMCNSTLYFLISWIKKNTFHPEGIIILLLLVIFILKRNPDPTNTVKVKKGPFPIEVTTTGELIAKSSDKIYGPTALRQVQIWQVKIQILSRMELW